jgi:hypothetical protein
LPDEKRTQGYIIALGENRYLSRSHQEVRHPDRRRSTRGVERAYVHPPETLRAGGAWTKVATVVIPAHYDKKADLTRIDGEPIPFAQFQA